MTLTLNIFMVLIVRTIVKMFLRVARNPQTLIPKDNMISRLFSKGLLVLRIMILKL